MGDLHVMSGFNVSHCSSRSFLVQAMTYFNEHKLTSASALLASRVKTEAPLWCETEIQEKKCLLFLGREGFLLK